jgi:hypothetical protein
MSSLWASRVYYTPTAAYSISIADICLFSSNRLYNWLSFKNHKTGAGLPTIRSHSEKRLKESQRSIWNKNRTVFDPHQKAIFDFPF